MTKKFFLNLCFFPLSILSVGFLQLNISKLISPSAVHATNWNAYNKHVESGGRNLNNGNYQKAVDFYNKALKIYKRDGAIFYNRALSNYELGNYEEAIEDYKEALNLENKMRSAITHLNIGNAYKEIEDFEKALFHFNKAISIKPNEGFYYQDRGSLYWELEKWDEALKDYEIAKSKYLKKKVKIDEYFYNDIGYVYFKLGSFNLAIDNYEKAIEINPKEGMFYTDRGDALYELGKEDEACENYIKSSELGYEEIQDYLNSSDGDWCKK
jgi:tetratricopeptide (TPR) repeat protein|tara:strand:+ start:135 stop:941 length:807 start_codon:yes stop_codon:yes gene_type:complete